MPPQGPPPTLGGPPSIPQDALVKQKQGQAVMIWAIGALVYILSPSRIRY